MSESTLTADEAKSLDRFARLKPAELERARALVQRIPELGLAAIHVARALEYTVCAYEMRERAALEHEGLSRSRIAKVIRDLCDALEEAQ